VLVHRETRLHISISRVYRRKVNLGCEPENRRFKRVVVVASNRQEVNAVVKVCSWWPNNGSIPVGKRLIVTLVQSIRDVLVTEMTLFGFLKLFVKLECSRHYK